MYEPSPITPIEYTLPLNMYLKLAQSCTDFSATGSFPKSVLPFPPLQEIKDVCSSRDICLCQIPPPSPPPAPPPHPPARH